MDKNITTIIIIAAVVAIIASLITGSITGNVINVAKGSAGKVYTTSEIDTKLKNIIAIDSKSCSNDAVCEMNEARIKKFGSLMGEKLSFLCINQSGSVRKSETACA